MLRIARSGLAALAGAALAGAAMADAPGPVTDEPTPASRQQATPMGAPALAPRVPAAPTGASSPAPRALVAELRRLGPPAVTPRFNDVMTAVLYADQAAVAQLLDLGRWVDKPDSSGLTPLMAAVLARDADMVQVLLARGADPSLQAPGGDVALDMARQNGDGASEALLLKAGAK